jgi:biofilm PGA synthesis protein PgaD
MSGSSLIIDKSSTRSAWARGLDWVLSALAWLFYLYVIRDVFIDLYYITTQSFAWMFDGSGRPSVAAMERLFSTLRLYGVVVLANGTILIVWALYNQLRFRGQYRRVADRTVSVEDLATLYRLPAADIARWQSSRILVMHHDADGTLANVSVKDIDQMRLQSPKELTAASLAMNQAAE